MATEKETNWSPQQYQDVDGTPDTEYGLPYGTEDYGPYRLPELEVTPSYWDYLWHRNVTRPLRREANDVTNFWGNYVQGHKNMVARNPMFEYNWDMANNITDFLGVGTGGLTSLTPSNVVGFAKDLYNGYSLDDAYKRFMLMENPGVVTEKFAQEHPYWTTAINLGTDLGTGLAITKAPAAYRFAPKAYYYAQKAGESLGEAVAHSRLGYKLNNYLQKKPWIQNRFYSGVLPDGKSVSEYASTLNVDGSLRFPQLNDLYARGVKKHGQKTTDRVFSTPVYRANFLSPKMRNNSSYLDLYTTGMIDLGANSKRTLRKLDTELTHETEHAFQSQNYPFGKQLKFNYPKFGPTVSDVGLNQQAIDDIKLEISENPHIKENQGMKHALAFYKTDDPGIGELGANTAVVKSNLGLNGQPLTTEEFLRFVKNPENAEALISHDIYNVLNYPDLVTDRNKFADFLLKSATVVVPAIYATNNNDKNEEVH